GGLCDGAGACVPCLVSSDCNTDQVCRNDACFNAIEDVGQSTALATSASVSGDALYFFALPALPHDAVLASFGAYGNAAGATANMGLYADDGTGTRPVGAPLAQTTNPMSLIDGATEQSASAAPALVAGKSYWVAFITNTSTTMRSQTAATAKGYRAPGFGYANFLPNPPANPPGISLNGVSWALYIVVRDTD
ncbi:MAG TPA: hypothetical protein VHU80_03865, partial [Polyangiaceae bacterium]|nr:hypothetical protein [Polyangiaceae bacterium]